MQILAAHFLKTGMTMVKQLIETISYDGIEPVEERLIQLMFQSARQHLWWLDGDLFTFTLKDRLDLVEVNQLEFRYDSKTIFRVLLASRVDFKHDGVWLEHCFKIIDDALKELNKKAENKVGLDWRPDSIPEDYHL